MADFISFEDLPHGTRAQALVGHYLQTWAYMESELNEAISIALGLEGLQGVIVCKNFQLRDKIHVLKTVIRLNDPADKYQADIDTLSEIAKLSADRNMLAHDVFVPNDKGKGDGVRFLATCFSRAHPGTPLLRQRLRVWDSHQAQISSVVSSAYSAEPPVLNRLDVLRCRSRRCV